MKQSSLERLIIFGVIGLLLAFIGGIIISNQNTIMYNQKKLFESVSERNHLDSLYWNHLEECSFLSRDDVRVGYNNYLQVTYKDGYGKAR